MSRKPFVIFMSVAATTLGNLGFESGSRSGSHYNC